MERRTGPGTQEFDRQPRDPSTTPQSASVISKDEKPMISFLPFTDPGSGMVESHLWWIVWGILGMAGGDQRKSSGGADSGILAGPSPSLDTASKALLRVVSAILTRGLSHRAPPV